MPTTTITPTRAKDSKGFADSAWDAGSFGPGGFGGPGGEGGWESDFGYVPARAYRTGIWIGLSAIVMLFAAFTSALVVRKGISNDWIHTELPGILWLNTAVLLASSVTLEISRRSLAAGFVSRFARWLYATAALGVMFVAGQWVAWRELASRGVYLATNPSSSFFYLLTGAHAIHLLGGIAALFYVVARAGRIALESRKRAAVDVTTIYWHFMDALWVYILLLFVTRL